MIDLSTSNDPKILLILIPTSDGNSSVSRVFVTGLKQPQSHSWISPIIRCSSLKDKGGREAYLSFGSFMFASMWLGMFLMIFQLISNDPLNLSVFHGLGLFSSYLDVISANPWKWPLPFALTSKKILCLRRWERQHIIMTSLLLLLILWFRIAAGLTFPEAKASCNFLFPASVLLHLHWRTDWRMFPTV